MRVLSGIDLSDLALRPRELITRIRMQVIDLRLEVRDYEYAETRLSQQRHIAVVRDYIQQLNKEILAASEYGIFSAVDVVECTTLLDNLKECLD
jgi:hypothetical protein